MGSQSSKKACKGENELNIGCYMEPLEDNTVCSSFNAGDEISNFYHVNHHHDVFMDVFEDWIVIKIEIQNPILPDHLPILQHNLQMTRSMNTTARSVSFSLEYDQEKHISFNRSPNNNDFIKTSYRNNCINNYNNVDHQRLREPSPAVSMESFLSGVSTSTNSTYTSAMCDDSIPIRIQTFLKYNLRDWVLTVGVKQAECSLNTKYRDRKVYWQVHITLLPQRVKRLKTKYKSTQTPIFNQTFDILDVPKSTLSQMAVRYRLYGRFKWVGRKKVVAEVHVELEELLHKSGNVIDGVWWTMSNVSPKRGRSISY